MSLALMMHHMFIILMVRLRREIGYWKKKDISLFDTTSEKREEIAELVWPKFGNASAQVKKEQADRVRESASALKSMSADELESFLKDLAERLDG